MNWRKIPLGLLAHIHRFWFGTQPPRPWVTLNPTGEGIKSRLERELLQLAIEEMEYRKEMREGSGADNG